MHKAALRALGERKALAYGATGFSAALLHNVFLTYYVHLFMSVYKLESYWFFVGEIIYMIWNSINDPLFGWMISEQFGNSVEQRLPIIRYGGALWAGVFAILFFPPLFSGDPADHPMLMAMHFTITMCLYDGCLSFVMLAHGALLADITVSSTERATCNMYNSALSIIGSSGVFFAHLFWDMENLYSFRVYIFVLAVLSFVGFMYTSIYLRPSATHFSLSDAKQTKQRHNQQQPSLFLFLRQLLHHSNFWIFIALILVQVFNCHFNSNFFSIFLDGFLKGVLPERWIQGLLLASAALLPHLIVVLLTPYVKSHSLYTVVKGLFFVKLGLSIVAYLLGSSNWVWVLLFMVTNKSFSEAICRHGNLILADIVDEDYVKNSRKTSMSNLIFGMNALFTKPGQSIAPILGWMILQSIGYNENAVRREGPVEGNMRDVMFTMLVMVPAACAVIQLLLWSVFSLRGNYLKMIKASRIKEDGGIL